MLQFYTNTKGLIKSCLLLLQVDHKTLTVLSTSAVASYYHHLIPALGIHGWLALSSKLDYRLPMPALLLYLREEKRKTAMLLRRKPSTYLNIRGLFFVCDVALCAPPPIWNAKAEFPPDYSGTRLYNGNGFYLAEKIS